MSVTMQRKNTNYKKCHDNNYKFKKRNLMIKKYILNQNYNYTYQWNNFKMIVLL